MKKAYIITGPESSGSVYISKIIAYVLGETKDMNEWGGYGFCKKQKIDENTINETNDIIILHRSQPYLQHDKYCDLNEFKELFKDYELFFILCTRYHVISNHSKKHRFQRTEEELVDNYDISKKILTEITKKERFFIWNYETMLYLNESYFDLLYNFLEINTENRYYPTDIFDGNSKYIKNM
jgi:hypothetical protein